MAYSFEYLTKVKPGSCTLQSAMSRCFSVYSMGGDDQRACAMSLSNMSTQAVLALPMSCQHLPKLAPQSYGSTGHSQGSHTSRTFGHQHNHRGPLYWYAPARSLPRSKDVQQSALVDRWQPLPYTYGPLIASRALLSGVLGQHLLKQLH
eukprot:5963665-Amphidinium_carterae.1